MSQNTQLVHLGNRSAEIYTFTGKVVQSSKNIETKVHGSGGGGFTNQGTGFNTPVNISSTTVIHDQLFVQGKNGEEIALQLQGFDLAVREGNIVTAFWAMPQGAEKGPYIAVINHSTKSQFVKDGALREVVIDCTLPFNIRIHTGPFFILCVAVITLGVTTGGAGFLLPIYYALKVVRPKVKALKAQIQIPQVELW